MPISSPGLGSGLDVNSIVSQLVAIEQRPLFTLQSKAATFTSQLSSLGQIQGKLSALQDAAAALAKPAFWSQTTASSSDSGSVSVSTSGAAASGSYGVSVSQLAQSHSLATKTFASSSAIVGSGSLLIELGSYDSTGTPAFTAKAGSTSVRIAIAPSDTLESISTKIKDAKLGVTATVINDGNGARLVIRSKETGLENALRIREVEGVADDGSAIPVQGKLAALLYDGTEPPAPTPPATDSEFTRSTVTARNAEATINGLALVSSSNTFKDVADGMSFTALKITTSEVALNVSNDNAAFKAAIAKFTSAFNDINKTLRDLTRYDAETKSAGALQGDRTAVAIQNQLRAIVQGTGGSSSVFSRLSSLGLEAQRDGSLLTNDAKLTTALQNPAEVGKLLASAADAPATARGIGALFESFAKVATGTDGTLTTLTDSLNNRVKQNTKEQERFSDRIEQTRARLLRQYGALDTKMASLNSLNSYVTQQITNWNKSTG